LLVVLFFIPGVGITSVPNVPAAADVPAVALYLLLLASLLSLTSLRFLWKNGDDYVLRASVGVADFPYRWVGESTTPRVDDMQSRQLPESLIWRVDDFPYQ
jgi:hypothetical protein